MLVAGFNDKLRFMTVLADDLRYCKMCAFCKCILEKWYYGASLLFEAFNCTSQIVMHSVKIVDTLKFSCRVAKEFPLKACLECSFSNGGQYFAAISNNTVHIFRTYTCSITSVLRCVRPLYPALGCNSLCQSHRVCCTFCSCNVCKPARSLLTSFPNRMLTCTSVRN